MGAGAGGGGGATSGGDASAGTGSGGGETAGTGGGTGGGPACAPGPLPEAVGAWEQAMVSFGQQHCDALATSGTFDERLGATYYDAQRVYQNISDYTGEDGWLACADAAGAVYRDGYVVPNGGSIPGYWNFPHGLAEDYLRTGNEQSRTAVVLLATNAAFCTDGTPPEWTEHEGASREVAYCMNAYMHAERVGEPRRERLGVFLEQALGHIDQWFVAQSSPDWAPFMFALTAEALIRYHAQIDPDPRIEPAIRRGLDVIWEQAWLPEHQAFWYRLDDPGPAPDLNNLIAPIYGWAYARSCDPVLVERGDAVFSGAVNAFLGGPKQFNQSYRFSFDYLAWRGGP